MSDFTNGYYERSPMAAVNSGCHGYDGLLPDFSPDGVHERIAWLEEMRAKTTVIDAEGLSRTERMYRDYLALDPSLLSLP